ncbi:MAG: hypothetical protein QXM96_03855 [Candidatus Woesearchaeota archaeon]
MKIAVIGSKKFNDYEKLKKELDLIKDNVSEVLSTVIKNTDKLLEKWANDTGKPIKKFYLDIERWGNVAMYKSTVEMVNQSDLLIAFYDGKSKSTERSIFVAKNLGKNVKILTV